MGARLAQNEAFEHRPRRGEASCGLLVEAHSPVALAEVAEVEGELEVGGGAVDACAHGEGLLEIAHLGRPRPCSEREAS